VYDRYLAEVFGFKEAARYHFDGITPDLPDLDARQHLHSVDNAAREVMSRLVSTWQPTTSNWLINRDRGDDRPDEGI